MLPIVNIELNILSLFKECFSLYQSNEKQSFNTNHPFAIISGFLILPAVSALLMFVFSIFFVTNGNPTQLEGLNLIAYILHVIFIPYLFISFYCWYKRKRIVRILMTVFFAIQALLSVAYMIYGVENEFMNVAVNTVWAIYFLKSVRVKVTFIN